jgi:hypothetical protein
MRAAELDGTYFGVLEHGSGSHTLCLDNGECWRVHEKRAGGECNNGIYYFEGDGGALLRVSTLPGKFDEYLLEIEKSRALARARLSPAIYATVFLRVGSARMPRARDDTLHAGIVMERYTGDLEIAQRSKQHVASMFVYHDTECALVDLYTQAARHVRCVDTKPANVVWRDRAGTIELGIIDVDPKFCGETRGASFRVTPFFGKATVVDLWSALRHATDTGEIATTVDGAIYVPALLVASVSLLVHCVAGARAHLFPYVRIAEALVHHSAVVDRLLELDELAAREFHMASSGAKRKTARRMMAHYFNDPAFDNDTWKSALSAEINKPTSRVLRTCLEGAKAHNGALYVQSIERLESARGGLPARLTLDALRAWASTSRPTAPRALLTQTVRSPSAPTSSRSRSANYSPVEMAHIRSGTLDAYGVESLAAAVRFIASEMYGNNKRGDELAAKVVSLGVTGKRLMLGKTRVRITKNVSSVSSVKGRTGTYTGSRGALHVIRLDDDVEHVTAPLDALDVFPDGRTSLTREMVRAVAGNLRSLLGVHDAHANAIAFELAAMHDAAIAARSVARAVQAS